jgi:hypothetical protein
VFGSDATLIPTNNPVQQVGHVKSHIPIRLAPFSCPIRSRWRITYGLPVFQELKVAAMINVTTMGAHSHSRLKASSA